MNNPKVDQTPLSQNHDLIGQLLLERGLIAAQDLDNALDFQSRSGSKLGDILVRLGALSEESLIPVLAQQTGYSLVVQADISREHVFQALERLAWSTEALLKLSAVLWEDLATGLHAAAADPLDAGLQEEVEAAAGLHPVHWHFMRAHEIERLLSQLQGIDKQQSFSAEHFRELAEDAPVIAFVNSLIAQAIDERASDIHIEPGEHRCEIRYRIDGVL
ncbi:MAG: hypothetical protein Q8M94_12410, partial [Ignavibacteria bacterium]|nr:hypothetical protein [Ignavibacteria bacterium]